MQEFLALAGGWSVHRCLRHLVALVMLSMLGACQFAGAQRSGFVSFDRNIIDDEAGEARALAIVDIDGDGLQDLLVLPRDGQVLHWYRNPDWQRAEIVIDGLRLQAMATHDVTGSGLNDLVVAGLADGGSEVVLRWLQNPRQFPGDLTEGAWASHRLSSVASSRQLAWADVSGRQSPVLVNLPQQPDREPLMAWSVPLEARQSWGGVALGFAGSSDGELLVYDWNGDGREQLLLSAERGVEVLSLASRGRFIDLQSIVETDAGVGAFAVGHTGRTDRRFLATIEPPQGNQVVVYRPQPDGSQPWSREVLEEQLGRGRTLLAADLNNDGFDEIIAGDAQRPYGLYIYRYDRETRGWRRSTLDSGRVAVSDLMAADITGNGFKDIVAVGDATANVVIFRNGGR